MFQNKKGYISNVKNKHLEVKCLVGNSKRVNTGTRTVYVICTNIYYVVIRGWLKYWTKLHRYKITHGHYLSVSSQMLTKQIFFQL